MKLEDINTLPLLQVLDKLGIKYKRESNAEYVLQRNTWEFANGWKANIVKNVIWDFSHWEAWGKLFWFVLEYLRLDKEQTFEWFDERFGTNTPKVEIKNSKQDKPIIDIWKWLSEITNECKAYLSSRYIDYELVKDMIRWYNWWIACLIYKDLQPVWCNVRTLETDHSKRFYAVKWYWTEWLYLHKLDSTKDYIIVVEWLIDFLTLRQFDTNVVGLKSNKWWLDEIVILSLSYKKIYFIPDNDEAGRESLQSLPLSDYYLFDIAKHHPNSKDINDIAQDFKWADLLVDFIKWNSEHIQKQLEESDDDVLKGISWSINDKLNLTNPSPFTFGLQTLDNIRGKFDYWQLHAVIWESWSGKTTFTFFQAMQNAKDSKVLYVSLEMQPDKLISLRARKLAWISANEWSQKTFTDIQVSIMKNCIDSVEKNANLKVVWWKMDKAIEVDKVLKNLIKYVSAWYRLIYIDNLWFIEWNWSSATEKLNDVIRKFQKFIQMYSCTIVLIHHFVKWDKKSRNNRWFQDVMGTAKLEHDIDYWLFVTRDIYNWEELTDEERATTYIEIKKDRENWIIRRVPIYFKSWWYQDKF